MSHIDVYTGLYGLLASILVYWLGMRWNRSRRSSPPGPRGLPLIGNALHMPADREWVQFAEWAKTYGSIVHLSVFGRSIVLLSSPEVITDLLEKRGAIYSDRPILHFAGEMVGYNRFILLEPYSTRLREERKIILSNINPRRGAEIHQVQEAKVIQLLDKLLDTPDCFRDHLRWFVAAVVFQISHGHEVKDFEDRFVRLAEETTHDFSLAAQPGQHLVDSLPLLKRIPDWAPGTHFKDVARAGRLLLRRLRDEPYDHVKRQIARGTASPSITASVIESNPNPTPEEEDLQKSATCMLYATGADTTVSALGSFFLIMTLYPEVQRKAQAELDSVVEHGRLPTFDDRSKLPYLECVMKEIIRWNPVSPLALPHSLTQNDVYEGYHIPAGSTVIPNTWAILHDPSLYPHPFEVTPERYIDADDKLNPDPRTFAFGYGRRVCPGQFLADHSLFIVVATVLSTMNIGRAKRDDGTPIDIHVEYSGGAISHPNEFQCCITPRSQEVGRIVRHAAGSNLAETA